MIQLISKALNLIAHYIIAIVTLDAIFGYITLLQATLTVAITFFGFNLQSAFVRYFFEKKIKYIFRLSFPILLSLFIMSLLLTCIALIYVDFDNPYYYFSLLPVIGFIHGVIAIISILSRSNHDFVTFAISSLLRPLFVFILATILIFIEFNIVDAYIFSLIGSGALVLLYSYLNIDKFSNDTVLNPIKGLGSVISTRSIFWYTFPLFITQIMSLVNNVSDKYILKYYLDVSAVGTYGKAYLFGSSFSLFIDSLMLLWLPYVIKNKDFILFKRLDIILKAVYISIVISFLILVIGFFLYFSNYDVFGLHPTFILAFFIILSAFTLRIGYQVTTPILSAYNKTPLVARISIFSMFIGLLANLLFIPYYGIIAAALATLVSFLSYSIISIIYTVKLRRETTV